MSSDKQDVPNMADRFRRNAHERNAEKELAAIKQGADNANLRDQLFCADLLREEGDVRNASKYYSMACQNKDIDADIELKIRAYRGLGEMHYLMALENPENASEHYRQALKHLSIPCGYLDPPSLMVAGDIQRIQQNHYNSLSYLTLAIKHGLGEAISPLRDLQKDMQGQFLKHQISNVSVKDRKNFMSTYSLVVGFVSDYDNKTSKPPTAPSVQ
jgi:tetratricopeptide (TPR) repeat protein